MEARLTEFSYGYCVTEELMNGMGPGYKPAPYFPSLYAEGQSGGGFDVKIGSALFLQFKLSDELTMRSAKETIQGLLEPTFFRFYLQRRDRSKQHKMLIDLENKGNQVYYIAPEFADLESLDEAYNDPGGVLERSALFSPAEIGLLTDDAYHSVAFRPGETSGWFLSTPKQVKVERVAVLFDRVRELSVVPGPLMNVSMEEWFSRLTAQMIEIIEHNKIRHNINRITQSPMEAAAYLARTHFGCELFLFAEPKPAADSKG